MNLGEMAHQHPDEAAQTFQRAVNLREAIYRTFSAKAHDQLPAQADLDQMLWPIALAAANLLTSEELLPRVGECADDRGCGWLFPDRSKNRSRQWCDINDCSNRPNKNGTTNGRGGKNGGKGAGGAPQAPN